MRRLAIAAVTVALTGAGLAAETARAHRAAPAAAPPLAVSHAQAPPDPTVEAQNKLVSDYCATCHDDDGQAGGLSLESFDAAKVDEHADIAEKMIRKLRAGMMPPPSAESAPTPRTVKAFVDSLETKIDAAAALEPESGLAAVPAAEPRRVRRTRCTICSTSTSTSPRSCRPTRSATASTTSPTCRRFSPTLMEGYLRAASQISRARGRRPQRVADLGHLQARAHAVADAPRRRRADGHARRHLGRAHLPGRRRLRLRGVAPLRAARRPLRPDDDEHDGDEGADRRLDQRRARGAARPEPADERDRPEEQPRHAHAADPRDRRARSASRPRSSRSSTARSTTCSSPLENTLADVNISFGVTALPHMRDVTIVGPSHVTGVSDTPSRRRIFTAARRPRTRRTPCATEIVTRLATEAYRGRSAPTTCSRPMGLYEQGRKADGFENGHPAGAPGASSRARGSCFRVEERAGDAAGRPAVPHRRRGARVAALVLPVGRGARRPSC